MYYLIEESFVKLVQLCSDYFIVVVLFGVVLGIVWSVGYLVYVYLKKMFDKYGVGLGINIM